MKLVAYILKSINIYTFVDERSILFHSTVFSSSDRDAPYVIDGLLHNEGVKSDMHSTDTHGYTEAIFAISHLCGRRQSTTGITRGALSSTA